MKVQEFENKYGHKGGLFELAKLRSLLFTQDYIANYFGVSKERVRQWMLEFFGKVYDPRKERREGVLLSECMERLKKSEEDFLQANSEEDFILVFGNKLNKNNQNDIK